SEPANLFGAGPELAHHEFRRAGARGGPCDRRFGRRVTLAFSDGFPADRADQLAAVASGLSSLTQGAARGFEAGSVIQTVVEMEGGLLLVMAISNGSSLAVLAAPDCDMGLVAYEMTLLVERVGRALTPGPRDGLRRERRT